MIGQVADQRPRGYAGSNAHRKSRKSGARCCPIYPVF
jgi:hypothetical protein